MYASKHITKIYVFVYMNEKNPNFKMYAVYAYSGGPATNLVYAVRRKQTLLASILRRPLEML
jgi:hypothetical protein